MGTVYTITEYGSFIAEKTIPGYISLPEKTFFALKNFILSNNAKDDNALDLMCLSARKGVGEIITAQNYVGMLAMKDGTVIEILPKIYSHVAEELQRTKKLLIDMLKTLRAAPYMNLQTTSVDVSKLNIFDIFIRMFNDEVFRIVKHGLKCDYQTIQQNENFYKGKLKVTMHIRMNIAHKERSYVEYDDYNINRSENRLIKTTLVYLSQKTNSSKNKSDIKTLLNYFDQVEISYNTEEDFEKCALDRNMKDYETALNWCWIFLRGMSFTSYSGSQVAVALLFPMETLFESYIAAKISRAIPKEEYSFSAQDNAFHLFDLPRQFSMRPDIVIRSKKDKTCFILDTKWKVLSENKPHYGISQADMYQMYAYHKKYDAESVRLIYPMTQRLVPEEPIAFRANDGVSVHVEFVDLYDVKKSVDGIVKRFLET